MEADTADDVDGLQAQSPVTYSDITPFIESSGNSPCAVSSGTCHQEQVAKWLQESFPCRCPPAAAVPMSAGSFSSPPQLSPGSPSSSPMVTWPVPLRQLIVDLPSVSDSPSSPLSRTGSPAAGADMVGSALPRALSRCSTGSLLSTHELVAAATDGVWKSLTKQCGHAHTRQKPLEWNLLRIRTMAVGSLRLSMLPSSAPEQYGLEMPTTGSDEVDAETGMFRTEDELAAFHRKMADMKAMLEEELEELRDQELGVYAQHIEDAFAARKKFEEMQAVLRAEMAELHHQERVIQLEVQEKILHPEPVICRPRADAADDSYSRRLREEGLKFMSSDNKEVTLRYNDLAPELDLSAIMSDPAPFPFTANSSNSSSSTGSSSTAHQASSSDTAAAPASNSTGTLHSSATVTSSTSSQLSGLRQSTSSAAVLERNSTEVFTADTNGARHSPGNRLQSASCVGSSSVSHRRECETPSETATTDCGVAAGADSTAAHASLADQQPPNPEPPIIPLHDKASSGVVVMKTRRWGVL